MKNLTWQNPEQLFVAQELINKVKSKCCGIKGHDQVKDNTNEEYNADIAIEGGEFRVSQEITLKAGETKTFVVKVFGVRENASALSGYVSTARNTYPWADTKARFYDISITK